LPILTGNIQTDTTLVHELANKFYDNNHPIRKAIYYSDIIPEIKTIKNSFIKNGK